MYIGEPSIKRRRMIIRGTVVVLVLLFLIFFRREFGDVIAMIAEFPYGFSQSRLDSLANLGYNALTFLGFFTVWVLLISQQALLPVTTLQERLRTAYQFILFVLGQHGPAVFVKDGKILSTKEDVRDGPGVAVVDFNSAIVLEERLPPPSISSGFSSGMHRLMWSLGLADRAESPRVMGPGIVYTRPRERIRSSVDLRRQFRMLKNVTGYTRNGIEVKANVWSIFTIGQKPDEVQVTYDGERRPENLRVVHFEEINDHQNDPHLRVIGLSDELDHLDRQEIHHFFRVLEHTQEFIPYKKLEPPPALPVFNRERVFSAVYSEARGDDDNVQPWTELPTRLAASIFREIISQVSYDDFYKVGMPMPFPLVRYRARLRQTMRNNGLLSFRLVFLASGERLAVRRVYRQADLVTSKVQPLANSKILRDRGIKVIASGFGDILPVSDAVYKHRLESWRAPWERDKAIVDAARDLEVTRIHSRARALAQQDLATHLNQIFLTTLNREVLAVRLLQSLEKVAADPKTRQLLPPNVLEMMRFAQQLLTPGDGNQPPAGQPQQVTLPPGEQP